MPISIDKRIALMAREFVAEAYDKLRFGATGVYWYYRHASGDTWGEFAAITDQQSMYHRAGFVLADPEIIRGNIPADQLARAIAEKSRRLPIVGADQDEPSPRVLAALKILAMALPGQTIIRLGHLVGPGNAAVRAAAMSALTGQRVPQSKAGITAVEKAFYSALGVPTGCGASMSQEFAIRARLAIAA